MKTSPTLQTPPLSILAATVLALLVAGIAIAGPAKAVVVPTPATKGEVFIVGDSLTVAAKPYFDDKLGGRGWNVRVDAKDGRTFAQGLAILEANQASLPPTVVIALGTNDMYGPVENFAEWVEQARLMVGPRRLIFVNLYADDVLVPQRSVYRDINIALDDAARANAAEIADWATFVREQGVQTMWDGVHYDGPNSERRASFLGASLVPVNTSRL
jgi:lysophospholipase L1-like esterase